MLSRINNHKAKLRKSEVKVAEWILNHPHETLSLSIAHLAKLANVSEPTVIRFCRALNCDGFQSFKQELGVTLSAGVPFVLDEVSSHDTEKAVIEKVFERSSAALLQAKAKLDHKRLGKAVAALASVHQVLCFGHGASGVVARDAQQKLLRLGIPVVAYTDPHVHSLAASVLGAKDVAIAISHTGTSKDTLQSAMIAKDSGCKVIAIAPLKSPLGEMAHICLDSGINEDTSQYMPMISRLVDLAIVDALAVALALKKGSKFIQSMERSKQVVNNKHQL